MGRDDENLTVTGLVETDVHLGDVFSVGTTVVQVCQPRSPCHKLGTRFGREGMPVLMQDSGFTGYLLRVLTEGDVAAGDAVTLIGRSSDVTVAERRGSRTSTAMTSRPAARPGRRLVGGIDTSEAGLTVGRPDHGTDLETDRLFGPDDAS